MRLGTCWLAVGLIALGACGDDSQSGVVEDTGGDDTGVFVPDVPIAVPDTAGDSGDPEDTSLQVDTAEPPKPGEFGYTCDRNDECNSGWCVQTADGRKCTRTCIVDCPDEWECRESPGVDPILICMPKFVNLCDPCKETSECNAPGQSGNYCLRYGEKGRFCGAACGEDTDCPGGYVCRLVPVGGGGEATQCVPADNADCKCSGLAKALQKSTICYIENEHGRCEGERFCTQSGLNHCDARTPFPESCNGIDDNCNGETDEFPPDYLCFNENEHGSCPGQGVCVDGVETCSGQIPGPEVCDGIDNNCNGETDEGLCDDGNPCTLNYCQSDGTCQSTPLSGVECDDGNVCTQVDLCQDGVCVGFNPMACGDGNPCYNWTCDPAVGCLSSFANGASCEDGNPCTVGDTCNNGVCVAGSWDTCNDGNSCTTGQCISGQGCTYTPLTGNPCGGAGTGQCQVGQCSNGICLGLPTNEGGTCTPSSSIGQCQVGACRSGQCQVENRPSGSGCTAPSSKCPTGQCSSGTCLSTPGVACTTRYSVDLCQSIDVTGTCAANGDCNVTQPPPGYTCPGCQGICLVCWGIQFCIPL